MMLQMPDGHIDGMETLLLKYDTMD